MPGGGIASLILNVGSKQRQAVDLTLGGFTSGQSAPPPQFKLSARLGGSQGGAGRLAFGANPFPCRQFTDSTVILPTAQLDLFQNHLNEN